MIYEELKLPLPVYDRFEKQYRFTKGNPVNPVIVSRDRIIPFQFILPVDITPAEIEVNIDHWSIRDEDRNIKHDLTSKISEIEIVQIVQDDKIRIYLLYKATDIQLLMAPGIYHMEFTVTERSNVYYMYSEQFEVRCDSPYWDDIESVLTRIDYDNNGCDLGPILYQTGYFNRIYLDTSIHQENPGIEEEGAEDGAGNFIPALQKYVDNLNIEYISPYYLADALMLMGIHRRVTLTTPNTLYSGRIRNIKPQIVQEDNSWVYRTTIQFQQDSKYYNSSCCKNLELYNPPIIGPGCNPNLLNLQAWEDSIGRVSLSFDIIGDYGRVLVTYLLTPLPGNPPQSGSFHMDAGITEYTIPDTINRGALFISASPQCYDGENWIIPEGSSKVVGITVQNAPESPGEPSSSSPLPPGTSEVVVENNSTVLVINQVGGIGGFSSSPSTPPQSGRTGTHNNTFDTSIRLYFDEYLSAGKSATLYVAGIKRQCINLGSSPASFWLVEPIGEDENILITVRDSLCV